MKHADVLLAERDFNVFADETMRHAVANGVDRNQRIVGHTPGESLVPCGERSSWQRTQRNRFSSLEAVDRSLVRCAVEPPVSFEHPLTQMLFERNERSEATASERIAFYVLHARLDFALGASPVRCTRAWLDILVSAECKIRWVKGYNACRSVAIDYE